MRPCAHDGFVIAKTRVKKAMVVSVYLNLLKVSQFSHRELSVSLYIKRKVKDIWSGNGYM